MPAEGLTYENGFPALKQPHLPAHLPLPDQNQDLDHRSLERLACHREDGNKDSNHKPPPKASGTSPQDCVQDMKSMKNPTLKIRILLMYS